MNSDTKEMDKAQEMYQLAISTNEQSDQFQATVNMCTHLNSHFGKKLHIIGQNEDLLVSEGNITLENAGEIQQMLKFAVTIFDPLGPGYEQNLMETYYGCAEQLKFDRKFNEAVVFYGEKIFLT